MDTQPNDPAPNPEKPIIRPENPSILEAEKRSVQNQNERRGASSILSFIGRFLLELLKTAAIIIVVAFLIRTFLIQPFIVEGESMEPNFHSNEYLIIQKFSQRFKEYQRGDVIIFISPENSDLNYIKRVIGLPGEKVEIKNDHVFIYNGSHPNGFELDETYLSADTKTQTENPDYVKQLTDNQYFVLGDNRENSSDSRVWGPLDKNRIDGKVVLTALPLEYFGIFHDPSY